MEVKEEEAEPIAVLVTNSDADLEQLQEIIAIGQGINEGGESSRNRSSLKRKGNGALN